MTFPIISSSEINAALVKLMLSQVAFPSETTAQAPAATGSAQLQAFLDAIPYANDGDVIRADHFNAIRTALAQLASALDADQLSRVVTPVFTPVLLPLAVDESAAWRYTVGYAIGPAAGATAHGWMPIDLPNQAAIDNLTVRAKMGGPVGSWFVELRRQEVASAATVTLCRKDIKSEPTAADGTLTATIPVDTSGLTAAQLADRRRIDTTTYRYLILTEVAGAQQASALEIRSFAVTCTRS
jgi:hypothetical protein